MSPFNNVRTIDRHITHYWLVFLEIFTICILAIAISAMVFTMPCYAGWIKSDMGFTMAVQGALTIGNGRNDGVMRLYSGDGEGSAGYIYEWSFSGGNWGNQHFTGDMSVEELVIGAGRNESVKRLYVASADVDEYSYASGSWAGGQINSSTGWVWAKDIVLGNARNDSILRLYAATSFGGLIELTYQSGSWVQTILDTGGQTMANVVIANGRNDNILRLYTNVSMDNHVYEYTWTGSAWQVVDCGAPGGYPGEYARFYDMVAGDGRNDGKTRLYLGDGYGGGLYELSYTGSNWQYSEVAVLSAAVGNVQIGDGRNDGMKRIYVSYGSYGDGYLAEYSYNGTWSKTSDIDSGFEIKSITIGPGRNDGINRVYAAGGDKHLYEYSPPPNSYLLWTK